MRLLLQVLLVELSRCRNVAALCAFDGKHVELQLIQTHIIQKQLLWAEVGKVLEFRTKIWVGLERGVLYLWACL